jgi:RNA polymerase sigma factor (TIGR02999 family)
MAISPQGDVTELLRRWSEGEKSALNEVMALLYRELRRLAVAHMRHERREHTLQPSALVHEAYLRMVNQTNVSARNRSEFLAIAAKLMREILVSHARRYRTAKRGGGEKLPLGETAGASPPIPIDVIALDEALDRLAQFDLRQSRIIEMRFFGGLTEEEIADVLGVSAITVKRDWRIARAVLRQELRADARIGVKRK